MFRYLLVAIFIVSVLLPVSPAKAFEQLPRSLAWELLDMSGQKKEYVEGKYLINNHYVKPGDTIDMWVRVANRSKNPAAEVWYGKSALLDEGPNYPNAHAIGVGMWDPFDKNPGWIDPSSFVINDNRFMYYDGPRVDKNSAVTLAWKVKIPTTVPNGQYDLTLNLVREFDEWGIRVDSAGNTHRYQSMYWKIHVGDGTGPVVNDEYFTASVPTPVGTFSTQQVRIKLDNPNLKIFTDTAVTTENTPVPWPVWPLSSFISMNSATIAINGSYFCPTAYESCAGKENTFNPMVYNTRLGKMINETRNGAGWNKGGLLVFDTTNKPYYFLKTSEFKSTTWFKSTYGADVQAAISNVPTIVFNGAINYGDGDLDSNMTGVKAGRGAIGIKGSEVFLVLVKAATVPDLAQVMQSLGMQYALNLDGGGSTALYYRGQYKAGPGRDLANAILFRL